MTQFELLTMSLKNNLGYDFDSDRLCFVKPASDSPEISDADAAAAYIEDLWIRASTIGNVIVAAMNQSFFTLSLNGPMTVYFSALSF